MIHVNETLKILNMELGGRIIMPPIATYKSTDEGYVTDEICEYYQARGENPNVSLIITEHCYISQQGKAKVKQMSIKEDQCIPGLKKLVDSIHKTGTKAVAQLNHAGAAAISEITGMDVVAPSEVPLPGIPANGDAITPNQLTKEEIQRVAIDFAKAAVRAKEAGYDGVEIHSAHRYLLNEFYSPITNKRDDEYGGPVENRVRIHREVIQAVRASVGDDYPIFIRLGACDYMDGGSSIDDAVKASKMFEEAGVNLIDITGGMCGYIREGHSEPGYFSDASKAIKEEVNVPIILTGGVKTLDDAGSLLNEGCADLIGVGRELFKNPTWEV